MTNEIRPKLVMFAGDGKPAHLWFIGPMTTTEWRVPLKDARMVNVDRVCILPVPAWLAKQTMIFRTAKSGRKVSRRSNCQTALLLRPNHRNDTGKNDIT